MALWTFYEDPVLSGTPTIDARDPKGRDPVRPPEVRRTAFALRPYQILDGRYRLLHELAHGGMGIVWCAEHVRLRSLVAVKFLDPQLLPSPAWVERLANEARTTAAVSSPHVVRVTDDGVQEGTPYLVMELLEGETLARRLNREVRLDPRTATVVFRQVASAIQTAHDRGIVHLDLKPANIFLLDNHGEPFVKILDFGIAQQTPAGGLPQQTELIGDRPFLGTPCYMSPEQITNADLIDYRSDLWSLAVLAFECITGYRPFRGASLQELLAAICVRPIPIPSTLASVPLGFDEWFAHGIERMPTLRFRSALEASRELESLCFPEPRRLSAPVPSQSRERLDLHLETTRRDLNTHIPSYGRT